MPSSMGHPKASGYCSQGEDPHFGRDPTISGRNRKSRGAEAAGRRNYPEAVPRRKGGKRRRMYRAKSKWSRRGDEGDASLRRVQGCSPDRSSRRRAAIALRGTLQERANFQEPRLNFGPRQIRTIAKQLALRFVFGADDLGQCRRWKQRVALGEAHPFGMEITFRKM